MNRLKLFFAFFLSSSLISLFFIKIVNESEKNKIYIFRRPPFSDSGLIDSKKIYYDFTNGRPNKCDLKINNACFIKTDILTEKINNGIIKVGNRYACSENLISKIRKRNGFSEEFSYGYGICTKDGWQRIAN